MENPIDQMAVKIPEIENAVAYWTEVLQKSEKYERLMADGDDFKEVIKDIQQTVEAHDNEIKSCLDSMAEYSPKLLLDAQHTIFIHQILKEQALKAMNRPKEILELAKKARKEIPELQEQLSKLKEAVSHG